MFSLPRIRIAVALAAIFIAVAAGANSVKDGVYTKEQAARGKTLYNEECARCHAETLAGGEASPGLTGPDFLAKWNGKSVGEFYEVMRKTMPLEDPSNLSRRQYADLTAYVLSVNEFPAGSKELGNTADDLKDIAFTKK